MRRLRGEMTQEELARRADFDVTSLRKIEAGKVDPLWSSIRRLAAAMEIRPQEVIKLAEEVQGE